MSVKDELLAIQEASKDGMLHCKDVVAWARKNPDSDLHSKIDWNNKSAADAYRLWQVRKLIEIHITNVKSGPTVVSLSVDRSRGGGYRSLTDVAQAPDLREIMLQDALNDLERVQAKYSRVQELSLVWNEVNKVRQKVGTKVTKKRNITDERLSV